MHITSIGIDSGKTTFHLVALGERNKVLIRKKFSRAQLLAYTANLPASLIGLEACAGAHFLGSNLRAQGHEVRLIPAQFIKPYRKSNKNDFLDAEAIAEAVTKENMRFVQIKTEEQLDVQAMHRVRDRLVQRRTALINEIRGFLLERGITFAVRPIQLRKNLLGVIEDAEQNLSSRLRWLLERLWQEWKQVEVDLKTITDEIEGASAKRMRSADVCARSPASVHWSRVQQLPPSAMELPSAEGATSPPGLVSCPGSTPPEASRSCSASANAATSICVAC
jgi:transposase